MDYLHIGSAPHDENCAQVGTDNYKKMATRECRALGRQLIRMYGDKPKCVQFSVKENPHNFGTYYELVAYYDKNCKVAEEFAFKCEDLPDTWDSEAKKELNI